MVEGSIYETVSGQPGDPVLAPVVFRPGFAFGGWFLDADHTVPYLGKEIPTTDLTVYAYWIVDSTDYHAQLVGYLASRYGWDPMSNAFEIDEMIGMYQLAFGTDVDQAVLFYAQTIDQAMDNLPNVQSMADVQAIWTLLVQAGIDEQMIENGLMGFALEMMDRQLDNYDPTYYQNIILDHQAQIAILQGMLGTIEGNAGAYCALLPDGVDDDCDGFFRANIDLFVADQAYLNLLNQYNNDWESGFDYSFWYGLEDSLRSWYFSDQQYYYDQYLEMLGYADPSTRPMYETVASLYMAMMDVQFDRLFVYRDALSGLQDADFNMIVDIIEGFYYEWSNAAYEIQSHQWMILEATEWAAREALNFEKMTWVYNYASSPEGALKMRTAIASIYGVVDHVMANFDPATFDLIYQLANGMIQPDMTPEGIHGYLQHLLGALAMLDSAVDEADIANLKLLAKDFIAFMITFEVDLPEAEKAALILAAQDAVDVYVARVLDAYDTLYAMMAGMTSDQIGQIMNLLNLIMNQGGGEIGPKMNTVLGVSVEEPKFDPFAQLDLIIQALTLLDDIASPQKEGIARIVTYVIAAKYDFMYQFQYDAVEAQTMMDSAYASVLRVFELAAIVRTIELDRVTPEQAAAADELMQQIDYLGMFLTLPPWMFQIKTEFGYVPEHFDMILQIIHRDLAHRNVLLENAKAMYVGTFQMTEEDTYYMMLSMMPRLMSVQGVQSFEDIRFWYSTFDDYGYTNAQIAAFMVRYMRLRSAYEIERTELMMSEQASYYMEMIAYYQGEYAIAQQEMAAADAKNDLYASGFGEAEAALIRAYYDALKEEQRRSTEYNRLFNDYANQFGWEFDWYHFQMLTNAKYWAMDSAWQITSFQTALAAMETILNDYCLQFAEGIDNDCDGYVEAFYLNKPLIDYYYEAYNLYINEETIDPSLLNAMIDNLYNWYWTESADYYNAYLAQLGTLPEWNRWEYETVTQAYIAMQNALHSLEVPLAGLIDSEGQSVVFHIQDMVRLYAHYETQLTNYQSENAFANNQWDMYWNMLSPEQQAMYQPAIDLYLYMIDPTFTLVRPMQNQFKDLGLDMVRQDIEWTFYNNYSQAYYRADYLMNEINRYTWELDHLAQYGNGPEPLIVAVLSDPLNEALAVDLVESLLNRIDTLMLEANPEFMNTLLALAMQQTDPSQLLSSPEAIEALADNLADVLTILLGNVSETDLGKVKTLLGKALWLQFESEGVPVEQLEAMYQLYSAAFDKYVYDAFDLVDMAILAIDAITADKVTAVMTRIGVMNMIDQSEQAAYQEYNAGLITYEDLQNEILELNLARAVSIANLVTTVLGDGTIDTDALIDFALNLYFDISYEFNYTGPVVIADKVLEYQTLIDQIVFQASVIDGYDLATLTPEQLGEIEAFHLLIEQIITIVNNGPEYEEIPA
jgi:hypothetical protein